MAAITIMGIPTPSPAASPLSVKEERKVHTFSVLFLD